MAVGERVGQAADLPAKSEVRLVGAKAVGVRQGDPENAHREARPAPSRRASARYISQRDCGAILAVALTGPACAGWVFKGMRPRQILS